MQGAAWHCMKVSVSSVKMLRMAVELSEYFADSEEKKKEPNKKPQQMQ